MGDFDMQDDDEDRPRKGGRRQQKQRLHEAFSARFEDTFGKEYDFESRKKRKMEEEEEKLAAALPVNPLVQERYTYGDVYKYKQVKNLGSGSFSSVFLGEDRDRNQFVLKKLKMTTTIDLEVYEREIDSLKACDHPNVLKLVEVCENVKGQKFLVLEYGGHNLKQIIGGKPLSQRECKHLFSQLLQGLERTYYLLNFHCSFLDLHSKDIIHRDLKSDNLLVNKKGILKIGDFGSSRKWERLAKITPGVSSLRYRYRLSSFNYFIVSLHDHSRVLQSLFYLLAALLRFFFPLRNTTSLLICGALGAFLVK
jgi:serine/threonine protein kinase